LASHEKEFIVTTFSIGGRGSFIIESSENEEIIKRAVRLTVVVKEKPIATSV
jgi:hypothetical protein